MAPTPQCLTWSSMTQTINEIKEPASYLVDLLFGSHETFSTEAVEVGKITGGRVACGFVRVDAEAQLVAGVDDEFQTISMPNIRLKMVMKAGDRLNKRRAGTVIFPTKGQQVSAMEAAVARDLLEMKRLIANRKELMAAAVITGEISFSSSEANFRYQTGKPPGHDTTPAVIWSNAAADPYDEFMAAKVAMDNEHSLQPNICIMSPTAADAFMKLAAVKSQLDTRNYDVGRLTTEEMINKSTGAMSLGRLHGIEVVRYGRTIVDHAGATIDLIRADHVEFIHTGSEAENKLYFGAIPDEDALEGRLFEGESFSKSWKIPDPSRRIALVHTRPLPVMRRPGSVFSIDVL